MKRNVKKMELKKRAISQLNTNEIKGGWTTLGPTAILCPTTPIGEDICLTQKK